MTLTYERIPLDKKTNRIRGAIFELIRTRGRELGTFSRCDFPELTMRQAASAFIDLLNRGEIITVKKAIRGRFGVPATYRFKD